MVQTKVSKEKREMSRLKSVSERVDVMYELVSENQEFFGCLCRDVCVCEDL